MRKRIGWCLAVLLGITVFAGEKPKARPSPLISPAAFTRAYAKACRESIPDVQVQVVRDLEVKVTARDTGEFMAYLSNAYDSYRNDPDSRDNVIRAHVAVMKENLTQVKAPVDKSRIVPVIKDRIWLEGVMASSPLKDAKPGFGLVFEELCPDLRVVYAVDTDQSVRFLKEEDLEAVKVRREELRELACKNLRRLLPSLDRAGGDGVFLLEAGGMYEASLLLLESIWDPEILPVRGEFVLAVPTRDILMITGSEDADGLRKVRKLAPRIWEEGPYSLSQKLFVYRKGKIEEFRE
ncbi:MAG: DUF1444 family protein [Acidobacteria bacterium]|nr:DUF1444 family protein [Acidobacteriota bacterium]